MAAWGIFKKSVHFEGGAEFAPMTFDVDVVTDIVEIVTGSLEGSPPVISIMRLDRGKLDMNAEQQGDPVAPAQLTSLSAYDRSMLTVKIPSNGSVPAPSLAIDFRRDSILRVESRMLDKAVLEKVINAIEGNGRLRVPVTWILPAAPLLFAAATTVLGIMTLTSNGASTTTVLFVSAILIAFWTGSGMAALALIRHAKSKLHGAVFREVTRAEVRERMRNAKATAWVTLVAGPIGAGLGALLVAWLE